LLRRRDLRLDRLARAAWKHLALHRAHFALELADPALEAGLRRDRRRRGRHQRDNEEPTHQSMPPETG
jgi:hypothetical protein